MEEEDQQKIQGWSKNILFNFHFSKYYSTSRETIPEGEEEIPPRPAGQRVEAPPPNLHYGGHQWPHGMPRLPHGSNFTFTAGIGPIGLYSYGSAGIPGPMTAQEAQQAHASKLVALIGLVLLFVIFVN